MINIADLDNEQLSRLITNRWRESEILWSEITTLYEKAKKIWKNLPDWLDETPRKRSKTRDNRIFQSIEYIISNLTARPSKPNVIPANETREAAVIANNLQDFFLAKYRDLGIKRVMRRALRFLFFAKLLVLKVFWNYEIDDFDVRSVNPTKVRFSPKATTIFESEYAIEEIEKTFSEMVELFPDEKEEIIKAMGGGSEEEQYLRNTKVVYYEAWIGGWVIYKFREKILKKEPHPYWDWEGLLMTKGEERNLAKLSGKRRRVAASKVKKWQEYRSKAREAGREYEVYLYNHLDRPIPPYIFGTILDVEDKPVGETSLIEQANPLQEGIDRRKRQFDDNADMANSGWKIDTNLAKITKQEAQRVKADPKGIWYGPGVSMGVKRESGPELPSFLYNDLVHSIQELDNLMGTQSTFRGERGRTETATGRAILREQSYQRLNEVVDLIDTIHEQLYNWQFQMVKVRYTYTHFTKPLGAPKAKQTIDLIQDDIEEGVEIKVIPGQVMPEDRMYKAERATEAYKAGLIDPVSYFEETDWENPMEQAKKLIMFKVNPFSILDMTDEDIAKLQQATQMMGQPGGQPGGQEVGGSPERAQQLAQTRQQVEQLINSPEFQKLSPEQQRSSMQQIQERMTASIEARL